MKKKLVIITFIIIFLLGLFLRLYDLDRRPIHHDEGVISSFVENVLNTGYYEYDPEYHGPFMYYVRAFSMILFGKQDFTLRIGDAIIGTLTILLIWPLRKYLGDIGMLAASFFITASPGLVYYSRSSFIDIDFVFFYILFLYSFVEYINTQKHKFLYLSSIAIAFMFLIKELVLFLIPGILVFMSTYGIWCGIVERKWETTAKILVNSIQVSLFLILFYFLNLTALVDVVSNKLRISGNLIYLSIALISLASVFLITIFLYLKR